MASPVIEPIADSNVEDVVGLLEARNRTLPEYTRWKYDGSGPRGPRGVIARIDGRPVACFGLVTRPVRLPSGREIDCSWFADWFVVPAARHMGLGARLLEALSHQAEFIIGHPGPSAAAAICLRHGYERLGFHSRRRIMLRGLCYERERTRYLVKAVGRWVVGAIGGRIQRSRTLHVPLPGSVPGSAAAFADLDAHAQWMARQPTAHHVVRILGQWSGAGVTVTYADIHEPEARLRRQILRSENETTSLLEPWAAFVEQARQAGCIAIDGFTTDARLDQVWGALGGRTVAESEILMKNAPVDVRPLRLHGWDRENWTYKAAEHPGSRDRRES